MKSITYLIFILTIGLFSCSKNKSEPAIPNNTVTDADGNTYSTKKIGNQTWMLENLKTTKYNDGTPITKYNRAIHGNNWLNLSTPMAFYQWADTSDLNNIHPNPLSYNFYGAMYNHLAIESGKLAPTGWRIPTLQDFIELETYLSNNGFAGNEGITLKTSTGWLSLSGNGTDAIGFKGMPNGYINAFGGPTFAEGICTWVTSNVNTANNTRKMVQLFNQNSIQYVDNPIQIGAGIRCIKQ